MNEAMKMSSLKRSIIMSVSSAYNKSSNLRKAGDTHQTKKYLIRYLGRDRTSADFKVTDLKTNITYPVTLYNFFGDFTWEVYQPKEKGAGE